MYFMDSQNTRCRLASYATEHMGPGVQLHGDISTLKDLLLLGSSGILCFAPQLGLRICSCKGSTLRYDVLHLTVQRYAAKPRLSLFMVRVRTIHQQLVPVWAYFSALLSPGHPSIEPIPWLVSGIRSLEEKGQHML